MNDCQLIDHYQSNRGHPPTTSVIYCLQAGHNLGDQTFAQRMIRIGLISKAGEKLHRERPGDSQNFITYNCKSHHQTSRFYKLNYAVQ